MRSEDALRALIAVPSSRWRILIVAVFLTLAPGVSATPDPPLAAGAGYVAPRPIGDDVIARIRTQDRAEALARSFPVDLFWGLE